MTPRGWSRNLFELIRRVEDAARRFLTPPFVIVSAIVGLVMDFFLEMPFLIAMAIDDPRRLFRPGPRSGKG